MFFGGKGQCRIHPLDGNHRPRAPAGGRVADALHHDASGQTSRQGAKNLLATCLPVILLPPGLPAWVGRKPYFSLFISAFTASVTSVLRVSLM